MGLLKGEPLSTAIARDIAIPAGGIMVSSALLAIEKLPPAFFIKMKGSRP